MKKTLLFVSLLATTLSYSQVQYTDINPDETLNATASGEQYDFDLNNDGTQDGLVAALTSSGLNIVVANLAMDDIGAMLADMTPVGTGSFATPTALPDQFMIDPNASTWIDSTQSHREYYLQVYMNNQSYAGHFNATVGDRYLGIRFKAGANTLYGWILVNVASNGSQVVVKEYAYNNTPGQGLLTGHQSGAGLNDIVYSNWSASVNGKTIMIGSVVDGNYTVVDASGRVVAEGEVINGKATVEIGEAGMFVVKFSGDSGVGTKKVVLN